MQASQHRSFDRGGRGGVQVEQAHWFQRRLGEEAGCAPGVPLSSMDAYVFHGTVTVAAIRLWL
jgi:hypothetical protein